MIQRAIMGDKMVAEMMEGLRAFEQRTRGRSPLLRAATQSFGFVYIPPLGDGNGRLSRFLINDILRRDGFLPAPVILPVSAVISENAMQRAAYDTALEHLSRPLMARMNSVCKFGATVQYEDGVAPHLHVGDWNRGLATWRYVDLTLQSEYLVDVIRHSILHGLKDEAVYLLRYETARNSLKEIIEGRDEDYATIIRSPVTNMKVSSKLRKTYPGVFSDDVGSCDVNPPQPLRNDQLLSLQGRRLQAMAASGCLQTWRHRQPVGASRTTGL